ncbi:MAG: fumarylacetoacetate hydrolase family protein [Candidatus Eremiobacteraeota bacterium]|nr:fumarylacetoacetate hydrolase family protein [Candidatus Eremiobacteraeota bacterium]MBC5822205.1 fumarylacetoacetate hydrolase family protein [Candidatus Eremiobacteraeota bacterium]
MRIVRYRHGAQEHLGVVGGEALRPFPDEIDCLERYLERAPDPRSALPLGDAVPLCDVVLLAPARPRKNVFCVGRNYMGHAEEVARARGTSVNLPSVPTFFTKAPTAIAAPGAPLHLSAALSQQYDWEAELAVVIGSRCRDLPQAEALSAVFGYTCLNDVTARDLQKAHQQWFKGKSLDETCPLGPWIVTADEVGDPQNLDIAMRVNGSSKQSANTSQMIFDVKRIIASLSSGLTLEPGDVIATGTPDGVGFARTPPEFLRDGDIMEVDVARVGVLRNTVKLL